MPTCPLFYFVLCFTQCTCTLQLLYMYIMVALLYYITYFFHVHIVHCTSSCVQCIACTLFPLVYRPTAPVSASTPCVCYREWRDQTHDH